jgi:anti-anti-sigma factor
VTIESHSARSVGEDGRAEFWQERDMSNEYRFITVDHEQEILVVTVKLERISDFEIAHELGNEFVAAVREQPAKGVVIDMRNVSFLASVGFGPLITLRSCVKESGRRLLLCNLSEPLRRVLTATRVLINPKSTNALFEYADSVDAAIEMLASQS